MLRQIDDRCEDNGHAELVDIIHHADGEYLLPTPIVADLEGDEKHDETVHELRHQRGTGGPKPYILIPCSALDLVEDEHIHDLADQEGGETAEDDPHPLPEYGGECVLHIRHTLFCLGYHPPFRRSGPHRKIKHHEGVTDEGHGSIGDPANCPGAIVFVDDVSHDKLQWPQQNAASQGERQARLPKKCKVDRIKSQQGFQ